MDAKLYGLKRQTAGAVQALMAAIAAQDRTSLEGRANDYLVALKAYVAALVQAAPAQRSRVVKLTRTRYSTPEMAHSA